MPGILRPTPTMITSDHTHKLTQGTTTSCAPDLASVLSQGQSTSL